MGSILGVIRYKAFYLSFKKLKQGVMTFHVVYKF